MVENIDIDRAGGTPIASTHEKGKEQLKLLQTQHFLQDTWRKKHPKTHDYTWSSADSTINSRIDRFYLSNSLEPSFLDQTHITNSFSDHKTLSLTLKLKTDSRRGEGYWKLNTSLLKNQEYCSLIENFITEWIEILPAYSCIQTWWIECKNWIKRISVDFSTQQLQLRKRTIKSLRKYVKEENAKPDPDREYIITTEEKIAQLEDVHHSGAMVRSREEVIIDGEKPSAYFYALEKIHKSKSTINKLVVNASSNSQPNKFVEISNETDILDTIHKYYSNLYAKQTLNIQLQDQLLSNIDKQLPFKIKQDLDSLLTVKELFHATKLFKKNKSLGIYGLPITI